MGNKLPLSQDESINRTFDELSDVVRGQIANYLGEQLDDANEELAKCRKLLQAFVEAEPEYCPDGDCFICVYCDAERDIVIEHKYSCLITRAKKMLEGK